MRLRLLLPGLGLSLALLHAPTASADELPQAADELPQAADEWPEWPEAAVDEWPEEPQAADELPALLGTPEAGLVDEPAGAGGSDLVTDDGGLSLLGWALLVLGLVLLTAPAWLAWALPAGGLAALMALVRWDRDRRLERHIDASERAATPLSEASRRAFERDRAAVRRATGPAPARREPFPFD